MSIFIFRSVFNDTRCAERTLIRIKQVCCVTEFHFGKGLFYKQTHALAVLLKRKYCLRFVYGENFIFNCKFDVSMFCLKFSTFRIESNQSFPSSRGPFSFVFAELTGGTKRDLCHGSKLPLIQPPSMVVDGGSETHAPCIVCWPWLEPTVSRAFLYSYSAVI